MPRISNIRDHQECEAIYQALIEGQPFREIAKRYKVTIPALRALKGALAERVNIRDLRAGT